MEIDLEGLPDWCFESGKFSPDGVIKGLLRYGYVDQQGNVDPEGEIILSCGLFWHRIHWTPRPTK